MQSIKLDGMEPAETRKLLKLKLYRNLAIIDSSI
jgi:hypothetical protein